MFDIHIDRFIQFHRSKKAKCTLLAHPNSHPYDSSLIVANPEGRVTDWIGKNQSHLYVKNCVNSGIHIISPELLCTDFGAEKLDLDNDIIKPRIADGKVFAYISPEYVKDIGTPERYSQVCRECESGIQMAKNLRNRQCAVFLDRDGTINKLRGYISKPEQLELIEGAAEAIRKINSSRFLAVVVTNQPVVARGECSFAELERINNYLEALLGKNGAYVNAIYYCPHHPDSGFAGEIPELKRQCGCRKPRTGLVMKAAEDFNIDLQASYMVGDSLSDCQCAEAAGCKPVLISSERTESYESYDSLWNFVNSGKFLCESD